MNQPRDVRQLIEAQLSDAEKPPDIKTAQAARRLKQAARHELPAGATQPLCLPSLQSPLAPGSDIGFGKAAV